MPDSKFKCSIHRFFQNRTCYKSNAVAARPLLSKFVTFKIHTDQFNMSFWSYFELFCTITITIDQSQMSSTPTGRYIFSHGVNFKRWLYLWILTYYRSPVSTLPQLKNSNHGRYISKFRINILPNSRQKCNNQNSRLNTAKFFYSVKLMLVRGGFCTHL